jgi:hypothetical protein
MIKNIIVISDLHCGCKMGLCPPVVPLDGGGKYVQSEAQKHVWDCWKEFWGEWVPAVTRKDDFIVVCNGDILDGVHHGAVSQISQNLYDQRTAAIEVMRPILEKKRCKGFYMVRGTEVHVGKSGQDEEEIAKQLGAIPNEAGEHARWDLWLRFGGEGSLVHFAHHIGTTSSASYESTAVHKEIIDAFVEAGRWGDAPPDCVVRSHRHRAYEVRMQGKNGYVIGLVTPGWQLKTPFVYRLAAGRSSQPQIGGVLIREGDEDHIYTRTRVWNLSRTGEDNI